MNCLSCGHDNPATVSYCRQCGVKLDMTADQISASLFEKAKGEKQKSGEYYARQSLFVAVVLFLVGLALFLLSGGVPEEAHHVPAAAGGSRHLRYEYKVDKAIPELDLPIPEEKK